MSVKQKAYIFNLQELNKTFQNDLLSEPINYMECLYSLARTEAKHPIDIHKNRLRLGYEMAT